MSSLKYWIWLSTCSGVGVATGNALLKHFKTPENVYNADEADLHSAEGIRLGDISALLNKDLSHTDKILADCRQHGFNVITLQDAEYPERLRNVFNPPVLLYIRGTLPKIDEEAIVAIVGTRNCTPYGISKAGDIGYELARRGIIIVSGLAKGVDAAAMQGALRGGGKVIGVIGSGLDIIYPRVNKRLFDDTASSGAIISEYPPGTPPVPGHFPARNRIVSGLSLGVAVIEAPKRSGALITAAQALEQGRDVFSMPGNVDAKSCEGSNKLLREGAIPLLTFDDIINEYAELFPDKIKTGDETLLDRIADDNGQAGHMEVTIASEEVPDSYENNHGNISNISASGEKIIDNISPTEYIDLNKIFEKLAGNEQLVARAIGSGILNADEIIAKTGLPAHQVMTSLTMLELKGVTVRNGGQYFSIIGE